MGWDEWSRSACVIGSLLLSSPDAGVHAGEENGGGEVRGRGSRDDVEPSKPGPTYKKRCQERRALDLRMMR